MTSILNAEGDPMSSNESIPMLAKVIAVVGIPGAIAFYLVWVISTAVASAASLEAVRVEVKAHHEQTIEAQRDNKAIGEAQVRLLRIVCSAMVKSEAARLECNR